MSDASAEDAAPPLSALPDRRPRLNREWHAANRMPRNASLVQRIDWHATHQANRDCRPPPAALRDRLPPARQPRP